MFSQLFGNYLVSEGVLTQKELREVLEEHSSTKVRLGTIAVAEGYMTQSEAEEINHLQTQKDMQRKRQQRSRNRAQTIWTFM